MSFLGGVTGADAAGDKAKGAGEQASQAGDKASQAGGQAAHAGGQAEVAGKQAGAAAREVHAADGDLKTTNAELKQLNETLAPLKELAALAKGPMEILGGLEKGAGGGKPDLGELLKEFKMPSGITGGQEASNPGAALGGIAKQVERVMGGLT